MIDTQAANFKSKSPTMPSQAQLLGRGPLSAVATRLINFHPNTKQLEHCRQVIQLVEEDMIRDGALQSIEGLSCKLSHMQNGERLSSSQMRYCLDDLLSLLRSESALSD
jgi:hypothetical protein